MSGWTAREELSFLLPPAGGVTIAPYAFAAAGSSYLDRPTAAERSSTSATAAGLGARAWFTPSPGGATFYAGIGYGGAFIKNGGNTDRLSVEIGLRF